ncbi:MAG: HAD family phosphatase [Pseudomonadales bacterium]
MSLTPAAVVLDLGGVLFRLLPERRLAAFAELTGHSPEQVRRRLFDSGFSRSCDAGQLGTDAAHREGVRLLGRRLGLSRFRRLWASAYEPDAAVVSLARRLKPHTQLALLTNSSTLTREGLEAAFPEVLDLFRPRLFSAEAGQLKPDPRLFRTLLDLLGLEPARVLYVDAAPVNVDAAAALGFATHAFQDAAGLEALLRDRGLL